MYNKCTFCDEPIEHEEDALATDSGLEFCGMTCYEDYEESI